MFSACIHLGVHDRLVSTVVYHESMDVCLKCTVNEVTKSPTTKNSMIVMVVKKQFMVNYILKSFLPMEKDHLHGASLELVMDTTLASPNRINFVVGSKRLI